MDQNITPLIDVNTRTLLIPATATGIVYLILSGEVLTLRLAIGAMLSSITCGYFGALSVAQMFHLGTDWYAILGAAFGFVGHMLLLGVVALGKAWRQDPKSFLSTFLPIWRRKE